MALGIRNRPLEYAEATVALSGAGAGTLAVVFTQAFVATPKIMVVGDASDEADGAVYREATSPAASKTGFTIEVLNSNLLSRDTLVQWVAIEKG